MNRRELREHCFKMLFSADFHSGSEEMKLQLEDYFGSPQEYETDQDGVSCVLHTVESSEKDREYLRTRTGEILDKIPELDRRIDEVASGWKTKRMGKVELTILRLAFFEMEYDETIPPKVSINEAVELAKKFGGDDAPSFVNGVLARLMRQQQTQEAN